jgi:hypothetical protein
MPNVGGDSASIRRTRRLRQEHPSFGRTTLARRRDDELDDAPQRLGWLDALARFTTTWLPTAQNERWMTTRVSAAHFHRSCVPRFGHEVTSSTE